MERLDVLVGDVNGDGRDDLVWNETVAGNRTYVGLAHADGTFQFLPAQDRAEVGWSGYDVLVGDVNGDGRDDLVWNETADGNRTYVGLARGDGTFRFLSAQDRSEVGWSGYDVLVGDVNGDGRDDLVWNEMAVGNRTYVGLARVDGSFRFLSAQDRSEAGWSGYDVLVGDVNGDGRDDLVWNETAAGNRTYVGLASSSSGTFTFLPAQDRSETGWNDYKTRVGDVNGDGRDDLIWNETADGNRIYVGLALGNGTFGFLPRRTIPDRSHETTRRPLPSAGLLKSVCGFRQAARGGGRGGR